MRAKKLIAASALLLASTLATIATTFAQSYYCGPSGCGLLPLWPFMDTTRYGYDPAASNSFGIAQYGHGLYDYAPDWREGRLPGLPHIRLSGTRKNQDLHPDGPAAGVLWGPPVQMVAFLTSLGIGPQGNVSPGIDAWPSLYRSDTRLSVGQIREAFNPEAASFGPPTDRFTPSTPIDLARRATAP
jgi:hypothetical protein